MVIATGFFDGVHLGHRFVLKQLVEAARERGDWSMVVTFWPHPRNVLQDDARNLRLLSTMEEKKKILTDVGVNYIQVIPFCRDFSRLTTEEYLRDCIMERFGGTAVLLGYDNRIGSDLRTPEETAEIAGRLGLDVIRAESYSGPDGVVISSTKIRSLLAAGRIEEASAMLGYDYQLHGVVVAGNKLGRTLGFPTANMQLYEPLKMIPGAGVYLVSVETVDRRFYGMCNIGVRPTVGAGNAMTVETNIFDFDEDIYGLDIRLTFIRKIRDEVKFPDLDALSGQLAVDRERCRSIISDLPGL
ncbi:MAG: riboflavin biosynthesis protein RibF [Candidatus Cryptobacteroides sp.]|nr:riboflavin biosynthesis protein RibF [Bacteroidales bacterium]